MASAKRANSKKRSITGANSSAATSSRGEEGGERVVTERLDDKSTIGSSQSGLTRCVTCYDEAMPAKVLELCDDHQALVEYRSGQRACVATDFVPEVRAGDTLLIHAGVAIARLAEERS